MAEAEQDNREAPTGERPADGARSPSSAIRRDDLAHAELVRGRTPGARYLRVSRHRDFRSVKPGVVVERGATPQKQGPIGRALGRLKRVLIGRPLATAEETGERVNKFIGLAIFASDNISSSAYATEEIMRVLILAGLGLLSLTLPITVLICVVLAIVVLSYRQVILAYPGGGGSYIVANQNLGPVAGLAAGAALLTDYILTVSVSVAAGVAAITSAFPNVYDHRVAIMVLVVVFMTIVNLRGVRESGRAFAIPTYIYLAGILALLSYGMYRYFTDSLPQYQAPPEWSTMASGEALGLLLLLRAFASGSVALTGTEAVSNGVPAFKWPEVPNAQTVLVWMGSLFAVIFLGISFLAGRLNIIPDPSEAQTVVSQLARTLVGQGAFFYLVQFSTAVLLVLAANTSFNGFPRLASVMAGDRFLPRFFSFRGDRLAFTSGIVLLALVSALLIVIFQGSVTALIPLYTIGVFVAFTLSQAGLVRHWRELREEQRGWRWRAGINALGAITTGLVAVEVAVSKFVLGAWMVLVLIPVLIALMWAIRTHYRRLDGAQRPETPLNPAKVQTRYIVPIASLSIPAQQALAFARALARERPVTAVHVTDSPVEAERMQEEWESWPHGQAKLVVIESPFRALAGPLLRYIDALHDSHPEDTVVVVLPEYIPGHWWEHLLHNQTALRLKGALLFHPGVVVANVPYHLEH